MNPSSIETCILTIEIIFGVHTYRENDAAQPLKDEDWRSVVITWVLVDGLDTHLHELLSL